MRFSAEWWTGFGLVFAAIGTITVMFCWWMDRRIARFEAEDAEDRDRAGLDASIRSGEDGLDAEIDQILRGAPEMKKPPEGG